MHPPKARLITASNSTLAELLFYLFILSTSLPRSNAFAPPTKLLPAQTSLPASPVRIGLSELHAAELLSEIGVSPSNTVLLAMSDEDKSLLATALGYLIGAGSLLLYTPIAVRVVRQRSANGLALSTWWLKLGSYLCSDVFYITKGYPISTYVETLTITVEAGVVLFLVAYFQQSLFNVRFIGLASIFALLTAYGLTIAPPEVVAFGQVSSVALNSGALLPQFWLNMRNQTKGDYSPSTALLASAGCAIRIYTTIALTDSDPILLGTFAAAFLLNSALLCQILYYGVFVEGLSPVAVFMADVKSVERTRSMGDNMDMEDEGEIEMFRDEEAEQV